MKTLARNRALQAIQKMLAISIAISIATITLLYSDNQVFADIPASNYATATITNPSSSLTDFSLMVDLSRMPANWWSAVNTSDGTKGRAAKNDGTELATDWINFNNIAHTGWLRVKWAGTLANSGSQF